MINNPFFSIIIPVYNRAEIITKTIQSVLQQEITDFELILIDDGSSDESLEVIRKIAESDIRIQIIALSENKGRCFARNTGLKNAQGNWICYLDSDDLYYSNHLAIMAEMITENNEFLAFAVDQDINGAIKKYKNKKIHEDNLILDIYNFIEDNPLTANQLCHSSSLNVKWSEERIPISEDLLFLRNVSLRTPIFKRAITTTNLIDHQDRTMNSVQAEDFSKYNIIAAKKFINDNNISSKIERRISSYTNLLCVNLLLNSGNKKASFQLFKPILTNLYSYRYMLFYKAIIKFLI